MAHGYAHEIRVKEFDKLFVEETHFGPCIPTVLFKDAREVPPLQFPQAANDRARAMPPEIAHDHAGVVLLVEDEPERLQHNVLRHGVPCVVLQLLIGRERMEQDVLVIDKVVTIPAVIVR